jgi:prevent-host-death family protein
MYNLAILVTVRTIAREVMPKLIFRNSHGQLVDICTIAASKVKNEFGAVLEKTLHDGAVAITRHDTPKAVLLSLTEFESLVKERGHSLDDLNTEFDGLLARMQTAQARKGVEAAFNASPIELGRAAVKAAKKHRAPAHKRARRVPAGALK